MWKDVLTIIHVTINVHSPCFHVLMRTPQLDRGISHVGKGTPDRKRNLEGGRDGNSLDLVVLVRSLSLPLAKIKVIVLTTLVYDNTRRQFSKRIIFRSFHEASAQHEKQHEFTLQNSWLFLPGDYPLTTDTEVKKLDFYAISESKARVLILIGWESGEKILNQSQIRKVQNQIFSTKTAPKSWYLLNSLLQSKSLLQKKAETSIGFSETCWHTINKTAKYSWLFFQIWAIDYICLARWCYTCNTTRFITQ